MKTITLSDKVRVSDPCYDNDVWCKTMLTGVLPGKYKVEVERSDEGDWGNRVARLFVKHEDYSHRNNWEYHSEIGVDSGQAGIFCESSYRNDIIAENIKTPDSKFHIVFEGEGEKWYEAMCKFTLDKEQWGTYDSGVVSSSGFGDGSYPLEVVRESNGYIVGMMITYISNEDEVEEDEEWDEEYGGEA